MPDLFGQEEFARTALLSPCGLYRYRLGRHWDSARPAACFIGLNPSTADASVDDNTIRRCVSFARAWDCGGLVMVNLFAWRATDPRRLRTDTSEPIGPDNDAHLSAAALSAGKVIAAWGNDGDWLGRDRTVLCMLRRLGVSVLCLGLTQSGHPRHPLYVRADREPTPFGGHE